MDIVEMARAAGLTVILNGRIGREEYHSVTGPVQALRRFGDAFAASSKPANTPTTTAPAGTAGLLALFEQWAAIEGLPLDRSKSPDRTFLWAQTEQAWFGFRGFAAVTNQNGRVVVGE